MTTFRKLITKPEGGEDPGLGQGGQEALDGRADDRGIHQTTEPSLNRGRYIETTMTPMMEPRITDDQRPIRLDRP